MAEVARPTPLLDVPESFGSRPIDKSLAAYRELESRYAKADHAQVAARNAADAAKAKDRHAYAKAMREGKRDPGRKIDEDAYSEVARTRREAEAADIARHQAADEVRAVLAEHGPAHAAKLSAALEKNRSACQSAVQALGELIAAGERLHDQRRRLQDPEARKPTSEYDAGDALTALARTFAPVEELVAEAKAAIERAGVIRGQEPQLSSDSGRFALLLDKGYRPTIARQAVAELAKERPPTSPAKPTAWQAAG